MNCNFFSVDIIGVSFEQRVYFTTESAGSVSVCAVTNVTLNGTQITTIVLETEDVTAQGWSIVFLHNVHTISSYTLYSWL